MKLTRYPDDPLDFLKSLRTVRFFEREPVSQEALDDILEVARWSGSARNRQPWKFLVVRDREHWRGSLRWKATPSIWQAPRWESCW
jgi:nitroreductase